MDIAKNLNSISKKLSNYNAKLLPVIKNRTVEEVKEVYDYGFREFGENRLEDYYLHSEEFNDAGTFPVIATGYKNGLNYPSNTLDIIIGVTLDVSSEYGTNFSDMLGKRDSCRMVCYRGWHDYLCCSLVRRR